MKNQKELPSRKETTTNREKSQTILRELDPWGRYWAHQEITPSNYRKAPITKREIASQKVR
jgi:hypothetical protein